MQRRILARRRCRLPPAVLHPNALAEGINNFGQICGQIHPDGVVWNGSSTQVLDRSATIRAGKQRRSIDSARPRAINTAGEIVGTALGGLSSRAVVWHSPSEPIVLLDNFLKRSPFEHLSAALGVNDAGEIVGFGTDGDLGATTGFLAIPN